MDAVNGRASRKNVSINVYNSQQQKVRSWDLQNAYPCKWTGPQLKADAGAILIETLDFAHEGIVPSR
jgi:phage tail-like protein